MKLEELENELLSALRDDEESIYSLNDVYEWIGDKAERVAYELDQDNHRWFQVATDVYQCDGGRYLGVRSINLCFNENTTPFDCDYETTTFEVYPTLIKSFTRDKSKKINGINSESETTPEQINKVNRCNREYT